MTTPQPIVIPGDYTSATIATLLPPATYRRNLAWVTDISPPGFMFSDGSTWKVAAANTILNGAGAPSSGTGNNGDYYLNNSTTALYGPKTSGAWGSFVNLVGSAGIAATIAVGTVTALAAGATPTVVNAGTSSAATFNFGIPTSAALSNATPLVDANTGSAGTSTSSARADHVHPLPTIVNLASVTTATDGTYTWTYPVAYAAGKVPNIQAICQATSGTTDVLNVQVDGVPTNTQCKFRVTRTSQTVVSLLGLTILSVPGTIGAQNLFLRAEA